MADSENHPITPTPDNERNGFISGDGNNGRKALSRSDTKSATHPAIKHQTANNMTCHVRYSPSSHRFLPMLCVPCVGGRRLDPYLQLRTSPLRQLQPDVPLLNHCSPSSHIRHGVGRFRLAEWQTVMGCWFSACTRVMADGEVVGDRLLLICMHGIPSCGMYLYLLPAHVHNMKE